MPISEISVILNAPLRTVDITHQIEWRLNRVKNQIRWENTKSPLVRIGTHAAKGEVSIFIELHGKVEGAILLQRPSLSLSRVVRKAPKLFTPHASFHKILQGLGYAPAIYKAYLSKGASFVTQEHTEGASKLWDKLASQGFRMIYVERYAVKGGGWANRIVESNSNKRLTVRCLLGKGAKPENLFYL
jgi:hypothetical protein